MPGVNPPVNEQFFAQLGQLFQRVRALETQQQSAITNLQGQVVVFTGLQPGSVPAKYGIGIYDPPSGNSMFFGETVAGVQFESGNYAAGASGFKITPDGNAEFNQLTLRNGIVGDDALTNPVSPQVHDDTATAFAITHAGATILTSVVTVPAGFTTANVMAIGTVYAVNSTGSSDALFPQVGINGSLSSGQTAQGLAGAGVFCANHQAKVLTGLVGGGTFTTTLFCSTSNANWAANGVNIARLSTTVTFSR